MSADHIDVPSFSPTVIYDHITNSPDFPLIVVAFAAFVTCLFCASLLFGKLTKRPSHSTVEGIAARMDVVLRYLAVVEALRREHEELARQALRTGQWPDDFKAKVDDHLSTVQQEFMLVRHQYVGIMGEAAESKLRAERPMMQELLDMARANKAKAGSDGQAEVDDDFKPDDEEEEPTTVRKRNVKK